MYSLFPARLCTFLFYEVRTSPGYLGFGVYLVIYSLSQTRLRDFLFYVEHASSGYLGSGVY